MPLLPKAHAAALLRRDDAGRTLFFPVVDEGRSYVVPDAQVEQRVFRQLRRIRLAQLAAWLLLPIGCIAVLALTDGQLPQWSFVVLFVGAAVVIQFIPDWARRRLSHGLELASEDAPKPSLMENLPVWVIVMVVGLAVGVVIYFGGMWPLKALNWFDEIGPAIIASKALAKIAAGLGGGAAVLWGGVKVIGKWLRSSGDRVDPIGPDAKT